MQKLNENLFEKMNNEEMKKIAGGYYAIKQCTSWTMICGGPHNGEVVADGLETN